jgi:hypothetical protein
MLPLGRTRISGARSLIFWALIAPCMICSAPNIDANGDGVRRFGGLPPNVAPIATTISTRLNNRSYGNGFTAPPSINYPSLNMTGRNSPGMAIEPATGGLSSPASYATSLRSRYFVATTMVFMTRSSKRAGMPEGRNKSRQISASSNTGLPRPRSTRSAKRPTRACKSLLMTAERFRKPRKMCVRMARPSIPAA